jgi:hypothetical protein
VRDEKDKSSNSPGFVRTYEPPEGAVITYSNRNPPKPKLSPSKKGEKYNSTTGYVHPDFEKEVVKHVSATTLKRRQ